MSSVPNGCSRIGGAVSPVRPPATRPGIPGRVRAPGPPRWAPRDPFGRHSGTARSAGPGIQPRPQYPSLDSGSAPEPALGRREAPIRVVRPGMTGELIIRKAYDRPAIPFARRVPLVGFRSSGPAPPFPLRRSARRRPDIVVGRTCHRGRGGTLVDGPGAASALPAPALACRRPVRAPDLRSRKGEPIRTYNYRTYRASLPVDTVGSMRLTNSTEEKQIPSDGIMRCVRPRLGERSRCRDDLRSRQVSPGA
jgi:hypothetical protein